MMDRPNYITPKGYAALKSRYDELLGVERPRIVEIVSWAAGNGDRSENGDYLYGRKRMREIDRELNRLAKKMKAAKVVDPAHQPPVFKLADQTFNDQRITELLGQIADRRPPVDHDEHRTQVALDDRAFRHRILARFSLDEYRVFVH